MHLSHTQVVTTSSMRVLCVYVENKCHFVMGTPACLNLFNKSSYSQVQISQHSQTHTPSRVKVLNVTTLHQMEAGAPDLRGVSGTWNACSRVVNTTMSASVTRSVTRKVRVSRCPSSTFSAASKSDLARSTF